jgi:hypothetical protein
MSSPKGAGDPSLLATVADVVAAVAAAALLAAAPACRTTEIRQHDEAVFGHFATLAAARAHAVKPRRLRFQGIKIENDGCGDYEVEIDGADTQQQRTSFAAEASKAGFQVTFEQTGDPLAPPAGEVYGVFAGEASVTAANAIAWKLAAIGFRYLDIVPVGRRWLVVLPQVPVQSALSIAREVASAGFHIQFKR